MRLLFAPLVIAAALQARPVAPSVTLTFDGGIFKHQTVRMSVSPTTYGNNYWRSTRDPRVNRLSLAADRPSGGLWLDFGAAPRIGTTSFDRKDEDDPNRNPYMRFDLNPEEWALAKGYRFDLVHVDVTITRLDEPGGRIEGTIQGRYELCTLPGDGGGNCTARAPLTIAGSFSVVRAKDRVID
jgi:hypothetical protein